LSKLTKVILAVARENVIEKNDTDILPFLYHHRRGPFNIRYIYRLQKLVKERGVDVICIEHSYFGALGIMLRKLTKKPFIIRSHNIEAHRFRDMQKPFWRFYQWYEGIVHRKANHSFFITEEDQNWAITHWHLQKEKCTVVTYGTDILQAITQNERAVCREQLISENKLHPSTRLFLFNGSLDYLPNTDALRIIITEIIPLLQATPFLFRIFICGSKLGKQWEEVLRSYPNIIYKGFVDDITLYFKGADCFINPVTLGSGIKTKMVDALAHNQTCISTRSSARGFPTDIIGKKLALVDDYDWQAFAENMKQVDSLQSENTPEGFYQLFNRDVIVHKALLSLQAL
jgi:glycosyltransferase involved in cell wall biosynthesis